MYLGFIQFLIKAEIIKLRCCKATKIPKSKIIVRPSSVSRTPQKTIKLRLSITTSCAKPCLCGYTRVNWFKSSNRYLKSKPLLKNLYRDTQLLKYLTQSTNYKDITIAEKEKPSLLEHTCQLQLAALIPWNSFYPVPVFGIPLFCKTRGKASINHKL